MDTSNHREKERKALKTSATIVKVRAREPETCTVTHRERKR